MSSGKLTIEARNIAVKGMMEGCAYIMASRDRDANRACLQVVGDKVEMLTLLTDLIKTSAKIMGTTMEEFLLILNTGVLSFESEVDALDLEEEEA